MSACRTGDVTCDLPILEIQNVSVVDNDAEYFGMLVVCRAGPISVNAL